MKSPLQLALSTVLVFTVAGCSKSDINEIAESAPETPNETATVEQQPF